MDCEAERQKARCRVQTAESVATLGTIGFGIAYLVKRFGLVRAGAGLYALDQLLFRRIRAANAREHGNGRTAARSWDL